MNVFGEIMLEPLLGSIITEKVLIFILKRETGYLTEISRSLDIPISSLVKPLGNLEAGGVLFSQQYGKTRVYAFNPQYPFLAELKALLAKAFEYYPPEIKDILQMNRRRPRRKDKPL